MAQRVITHTILTDDLTGLELPEGKGRTVRFGLDGEWYEIDLADENAKSLTEVLDDYIEHGRKYRPSMSSDGRRSSTRRSSGGSHDKDETRAARAWLVEHGHLRAESRGRIAGELWDLYRNRGNTSSPAQGTLPTEPPAPPKAEPKAPANATPAKKAEPKAKEPAAAKA